MIQPKDELIRDTKISGIKKQVSECINAAFSKGYETCFEQKKEIEDRAYQKGLEDMCNAFRVAYELSDDQMETVFDDIWFSSIFRKYTPAEFVKVIEDWKQKQEEMDKDEIRVGDEVEDYQGNILYAVDICDGYIRCWTKEGMSVPLADVCLKKTGKHIDGIAEVLKQMQE